MLNDFTDTKADSNAQARNIKSHGGGVCCKQNATGTAQMKLESWSAWTRSTTWS